jgi:cell division transport system permease protein
MARASPLPFTGDDTGRFLPWIVALMAFLATLAVGAGSVIHDSLDRWDLGLRGTLTVLIPAPAADLAWPPDKIEAVMNQVRSTPGVLSVEPVPAATQARLLKPWLGSEVDPATLPLPVLLDVHLAQTAILDEPNLLYRLRKVIPGTSVETHGAWLGRVFGLMRVAEIGAAIVVGLIAGTAIITVIFATRTRLLLHVDHIDLLHLIGAPDGYIARQFQNHAFKLGFKGGALGLLPAVLVFAGVKIWGRNAELVGDMAAALEFPMPVTIGILCMPLGLGIIALITARITVLRVLGSKYRSTQSGYAMARAAAGVGQAAKTES